MRIFQTIESSTNINVNTNRTWYRNLYEPLIDLGHDVYLFPSEPGRLAMKKGNSKLRSDFSERLLEAFIKEHKRKPFDLFFSYFMDGMVDPSVIDQIRKIGIPTCNFSCNNVHQFYLVQELSPHFDYNLHAEKNVRDKFLNIGANPLWWPMASNPNYFKPLNLPRDIEVSFVGANYALRAKYIFFLLENGIDVHAYGPGWQWGAKTPLRSVAKKYYYLAKYLTALSSSERKKYKTLLKAHEAHRSLGSRFPDNLHNPIPDDFLISLYSRSKISLGFLDVYDQHDPTKEVLKHLHLREFEAPICGALYLTGYSDELAEMFEPDKEVLVYHDNAELIDKVRYFLTHNDEGDRIRQAGLRRASREHTYHNRFKHLFEHLGMTK